MCVTVYVCIRVYVFYYYYLVVTARYVFTYLCPPSIAYVKSEPLTNPDVHLLLWFTVSQVVMAMYSRRFRGQIMGKSSIPPSGRLGQLGQPNNAFILVRSIHVCNYRHLSYSSYFLALTCRYLPRIHRHLGGGHGHGSQYINGSSESPIET